MKKIFAFLLLFMFSFSLYSCNGKNKEEAINVKDMKVETFETKNKVSNKKEIKLIDAFYDNNDNWYYIYEIGSIARMPL